MRSSTGSVPKPVLVGRHAQVDRGAGEQRLAGGEVQHFAIARRLRPGRCRRPAPARPPGARRRRRSGGEVSPPSDSTITPATRSRRCRSARSASAPLRSLRRAVAAICSTSTGRQRLAEGQQLDRVLAGELRLQVANDLRARGRGATVRRHRPAACSATRRPAPAAGCCWRPPAAPARRAAAGWQSTAIRVTARSAVSEHAHAAREGNRHARVGQPGEHQRAAKDQRVAPPREDNGEPHARAMGSAT